MKVTKEQYEKALRDYDRVGEELDDAKEDGSSTDKVEALRKELKSLEDVIHAYEHDYELKVSESYKQKVHRYSYPKGYKKLKHVKLFEQFQMSEGTRTIDEPVILLAIRCKSADEFKKELEAYKEENPDTYVTDVTDAQHRLGLPLNAENDPALIYDKAKSIQA